MVMDVYDAHCHLDPGADTPYTLAPSENAARGRLLCGVKPDDWNRLAGWATGWPGTTAAFGLHPWYGDRAPADWPDRLEEALRDDPGAWLGEAGLDGLRADAPDREIQERVFSHQLALAFRLDRPINIHCVKAFDRLLDLLDSAYLRDGARPFIVHSFGGPHQFVRLLADRGAYFSLGPLASRPGSRRQRARAALIPEDRLLLESDAFLLPGRDALEDLEYTAAWLAEARGLSSAGMLAVIEENRRRLYRDA